MSNSFLWVENYRPTKLKDIILPEKSKKVIRAYIKKGDLPHLLFHTRKPGSGKTTLARTIGIELESDVLFINGSKDGGMDTLRGVVDKFASTIGILGGKKIVIVDEADHISNKFSDAMRGVLEAFHSSCSFIFTCNNLEKIIEPIQSRTQKLSFDFTNKDEIYQAKIKIYKRLEYILKEENVEFLPEVLLEIINKKFPDIRSMIQLLQYESQVEGKINADVLDKINEMDITKLYGFIKEKKWKEARTYISEGAMYSMNIYKQLFDNMDTYIEKGSIPQAVLLIGEYQYRSTHGVDEEINLICLITELMANIKFQ